MCDWNEQEPHVKLIRLPNLLGVLKNRGYVIH
jgi:hypothetical protein